MIKKHGINFEIESGAGEQASMADKLYEEKGAKIVDAKQALNADVVLKVRPPQFN